MIRRVPPMAIAIVLVAGALVATVWSTRTTAMSGYAAVRDGEALAVLQAVRADFADLGGPPTEEDLALVVREHQANGLRYIAMLDARGNVTASAGTPTLESAVHMDKGGIHIEHFADRVRIEVRAQFRRAWGPNRGAWWIAMEIEPGHATELRNAATRTLLIGSIAALMLIGIAAWLVRRELQKRAEERERERERRLASLGEMSAVLAHEIRNPLASLKGNAQLLAAALPEGEKSRAKAERVVDEAVRLEKLTQDLLQFVRTGELARTQVSPAYIVREVARESEPALGAAVAAAASESVGSADGAAFVSAFDAVGAAGVSTGGTARGKPADGAVPAVMPTIVVDDAGAPANWSLDGARIREVIVNLIDNAIAAGPPVKARVAREHGHLVIEISDGGPGVKPEDREKIFEPFFTGKTRGTGLGLAIARRVVELHGGTIRVDEAAGGGALFRIEIPEA